MLRLSTLAAAVVLVSIPIAARAESGLAGGTMQIEVEAPDDDETFEPVSEEDVNYRLRQRINRAHCLCDDADSTFETQLGVRLSYETTPSGSISSSTQVELWVGTTCDTTDLPTRERNCGTGPQTSIAASSLDESPTRRLEINQVVNPTGETLDPACSLPTQGDDFSIFAMVDPEDDGTFDDVATFKIIRDLTPPPVPGRFTRLSHGENAISFEFDQPEDVDDVRGWQVLCARADDGAPAFDTPAAEPLYQTSVGLCGVPDPFPISGTAAGIPAGMLELDEAYICGEGESTVTELRVNGLENGVGYHVMLVAVDWSGNARGFTTGEVITPQQVTDFWEGLHEHEDYEGGFCLVAETYGDRGGPGGALTAALRDFRDETLASTSAGRWLTAVYYDHAAPLGELARGSVIARIAFALLLLPLVLIALAWHVLTLPGLLAVLAALVWLRRNPGRLRLPSLPRGARRLLVGAAVLLAGPASAAAQTFAPYWDQGTDFDADQGIDASRWHIGLKFGPFEPAIDDAIDGADPFEDFFGKKTKILPVFDVDWLAFRLGGGQLGLGGSIGFFGDTKAAHQLDGSDADGDKTSFRLVPLSLQVSYRWTKLDDEWGVPLVPYARGGLAYSVWWITRPDGNLARIPDDPACMDTRDETCPGDKARGGSAGLVGSLGLAVRAERIDPDAAASMRESGIEHAGFYAEYQLGWIDGFGQDGKLPLGDNTFFVGFDFEF